MSITDVQSLFTIQAIAQRLKIMPPLRSSIMDTVFTDRVAWGLPRLSREKIYSAVKTLPLVRRGAPSIPVGNPSGGFEWYAPLALHPNKVIAASDFNDRQLRGLVSLEQWAAEITDELRRGIHESTEGMASTALTGKISWPVKIEGGYEPYEVDFGTPLEVAVETKLTGTSKPNAVFDIIQAQEELVNDNGYGGTYDIFAGRTAYSTIYQIIQGSTSTAKISLGISAAGIDVGGYIVKRMGERYRNPQTEEMVQKVGDKDILFVAKDAGHRLFYCAVDDLAAKLQPMPFFIKSKEIDDPSGYKLIAQSKPFPVVNVLGICKATVIA